MSQADDFYLIDLQFKNDVVSSRSKDLQLVSGVNNALQALFNRLVTVPGSLAHHPLYGVGAKLWQNKISSIGNQRELALAIKAQFEQDFRVEKFVSLSFLQKNNGEFHIRFKVNLKGTGEVAGSFDPFGEFEI